MKYTIRLLLIAISIITTTPLLHAAEPVEVDSLVSEKLGRRYDFLEDAAGKYTIKDVSGVSDEFDYRWRPADQDALNKGYTKSVYWLRFTLQNGSKYAADVALEVEYALLNLVTLYAPDKDGSFIETRTGNRLEFGKRPVKHRTYVFPVSVSPGGSVTCYLRCETAGTMSVPVTLCSAKAMQEKMLAETMFLFMFYGIMLIMALYNLLIFISSRDLSYGYYVMYIVMFGLVTMAVSGHADQFLWPRSPGWGTILIPPFVCLIALSIVQFGRHFINSREHAPGGDRVSRGFAAVCLAAAVITPFVPVYAVAMRIAIYLGAVTLVYHVSFFTLILIRKRVRTAGYFMAAFTLFFLGTILFFMKSLGIIEESLFATYGMHMGAVAQVTILSLGLADRLNSMRKELVATNTSLVASEKMLKERAEFLEKAVATIRETAVDLIAVSGELSTMSEGFSMMAQDQASASEEMSAAFEELASSLDMIKNSTQDQKTEVEKTAALMRTLDEAQEDVSRGNQSLTDNIANISQSTENTRANLQQMISMMDIINDGGSRIANFITIIDDISDKINLLSLNAAIEAARAGEYGRGFAVVSDEIGKLAGATSDNSREIAKVISKITADIVNGMKIVDATRTSTETVLNLMTDINSQVENVRILVADLKKALTDVFQKATRIDTLSRNIADSTVEQSVSMRATIKMVETLSENAQKLQSSNTTIISLAGTLRNKIDVLKDLVSGIR